MEITIPHDIVVTNGKEKEIVSFKSYVYNTPLMDSKFHQNYHTLIIKENIIEKLIQSTNILSLDQLEYNLLKHAVEYPSSSYNVFAYQYLVFMKAIMEATIK